ncbi:MAG: RluA family pseudouridine synthase [Thermodesulfobacteriaceae bacterium]|nr:RluA family pseudouridine synthase [Thermodesulfobacteriaceae bacterium]
MEIIYEDKYLIVVNKPAGWIVQGAKAEENSLLRKLKELIKIREGKKGEVFLGVVHRLDKVVSGALVLAKRSKVAQRLGESFQKGEVVKTYLAVVEGNLSGEGLWENYLRWDPVKKRTLVLEVFSSHTKVSQTIYKSVYSSKDYSIVLLSPLTGRKHQLRAVLAKMGHPILGDVRYGSKVKVLKGEGILLHAWYLSFPHPLSKEKMEFWAKIPSYFPKFFEIDLRGAI